MGIVRMVDYTRGSHNVYKERYSDPALWQKKFDADIRFWLKFNADWYESVILSKDCRAYTPGTHARKEE
jgi:hypothetical protein